MLVRTKMLGDIGVLRGGISESLTMAREKKLLFALSPCSRISTCSTRVDICYTKLNDRPISRSMLLLFDSSDACAEQC